MKDCNSNNDCGCQDSSIPTPCTYTDCSVGNERCAEIQCAECVSYCGTTFQVETGEGSFKVEKGERLDSIIQRLVFATVNGFPGCSASNLHHAPYNLYATNITNTTVDVVWDRESSETAGIDVQYDTLISPSGWVTANTVPVAPGVFTYNVSNLAPDTNYKIRLVSTVCSNLFNSVELIITTVST